jgi:hypothetical protein
MPAETAAGRLGGSAFGFSFRQHHINRQRSRTEPERNVFGPIPFERRDARWLAQGGGNRCGPCWKPQCSEGSCRVPDSSLQAQPAPASSASTSLQPEARRHSALPDRTRHGTTRSVYTAGPRTCHSAGPSAGELGGRRKSSSLVRLLRLDSNRRVVGHDPFGRRSKT